MDVEIRMLNGDTWVTSVADDELPEDRGPGAAVKYVGDAIRGGTPLVVRPASEPGPRARRLTTVFNPGTVVSLGEESRRPGGFGRL
jgi:hypothetical protein